MQKIRAFYSDPHFGHKNIITYANRPFNNVEHMTEGLIENYNQLITPDDTVLWLGDCAFCKMNKFKPIMNRLNGRKILIKGNHDRCATSMLNLGFDLVMDECFLQIAGKTCRLKHYPYMNSEPNGLKKDDRYAERRPPYVPGEILIHGHTHSSLKSNKNMIHVGVDAWDWKPALYEEIVELIIQSDNLIMS